VDEHGDGNFTVSENVLEVFSEPTHGAPHCVRIFHNIIAVVGCSGVQFDVPAGAAQSADCFSIKHAKHSSDRLGTRSVDILNATEHIEELTEKNKRFKRPRDNRRSLNSRTRLRQRDAATVLYPHE
jgi:hypothetical protein